jgi:hypothetical protein
MVYNITYLPFFKLYLDELYDLLKEVGHTSCHQDVPLFIDEGEDCLLLVHNSRGALGWLLASSASRSSHMNWKITGPDQTITDHNQTFGSVCLVWWQSMVMVQ